MNGYPYRVFVSYSRPDREWASAVVDHLKQIGLKPRWDANLQAGASFTDQIKDDIAHAHAFIPLLTKEANRHPWVHQEIGYAMGLRVPVLPLAVGKLPNGLAQQLQSIPIPDVAALEEALEVELTFAKIDALVERSRNEPIANFEWAELLEPRTELLVKYAHWVRGFGEYAHVRQAGALSSFSLPDRPFGHPIWDEISGDDPLSAFAKQKLGEERRILEAHAREKGCTLIVSPGAAFACSGARRTTPRIRVLIEFLESMPDDKVAVAFQTGEKSRNELILGDWFAAESQTRLPGVGYEQTICTCHAPTVLNRLAEFEHRIGQLGKLSRPEALDKLQGLI